MLAFAVAFALAVSPAGMATPGAHAHEAGAHAAGAQTTGAGADPGVRETPPGYRALGFAAPEPGSYELPALGTAADAGVIDTDGRARRLYELFGDGIAVLSFIYTSCSETDGCPLATFVLGGVQSRLLERAELRDNVRMVSVSFDPERDTPATLARYAERVVRPPARWSFVTTDSEETLRPLLAAYGQSVTKDVDRSGRVLGTFSHVLRVFLIDTDKRIRNVYSTSFLHADTLVADIDTLLGEDAHAETASSPQPHDATGDLLRLARSPPLGLPPVVTPASNPVTAPKVALGRKLFFDRRLSRNDTFSCAMCHVPAQGFTSNEMATAVGIEGRTVKRNAPTLLNVAYAPRLFHDARESALEQQIWGPLLAANEMGNPSVGYVLDEIRSLPDYDGLFEAAFEGRTASMETLGMALATFERTLLAADSPFDRWKWAGDAGALDPAAARGLALFTGKAGCAGCHTIGERSALFTDFDLHHTGVGMRALRARTAETRRIEIAPGAFIEVRADAVADASETPPTDLGRYEVTEDPADRWKYKTPTLRNVALTAPYMHDGSLATLRAVVEYYDRGGEPSELLDPRIRTLHLEESEIDDLVAFLGSLTGSGAAALAAAFDGAPIGDALAAP